MLANFYLVCKSLAKIEILMFPDISLKYKKLSFQLSLFSFFVLSIKAIYVFLQMRVS